MIVGIGTDIIEIDRIKNAVSKAHFLGKYFTAREVQMYRERKENAEVLAGNFAVKEAVSKVFGTGFRDFSLTDIEVLRDDLGKPYVNLYGNALVIAKQLEINELHVSISHCKTYAVGYCVGEK